ncbi:MAG: T9SS type A sorting domain-containing protein [Prevotellaceae bacterium]|nr:T9SS type A sorting domain-containing protein [Candidatus Minthosoma equi]
METEGECEGNGSGHGWYEDKFDPTCAMPGYTVHGCYYCDLKYYTDFTDIEPDNHFWYVESDEHVCTNGCAEHGASWAEHTMEEGKCTVCGYWPGHTEHQWLTDSNGHFCTIPGCEHSGYEYHTTEEGSCACTVCGHIEHQYENGVCQNCGTGCQHKSITLDEESITDVDGEPVVITLTDDGYYATDGMLYSIETYCSEKSKASLPIPAYRAYFAGNVSPSGAPLRINIDDDEATAIAAISALTEGKAEIYDMSGRRIQSLQNGVNIVKYGNGITKKVIIK